jgi:transcriptional regulator with XRE-family HTH domain
MSRKFLEICKLRDWRERQRLTLEDVSDLTGLSISMISRLERGERRLKAPKKVLLARRLNVRVRDIFEVIAA